MNLNLICEYNPTYEIITLSIHLIHFSFSEKKKHKFFSVEGKHYRAGTIKFMNILFIRNLTQKKNESLGLIYKLMNVIVMYEWGFLSLELLFFAYMRFIYVIY